jgi:uncharacterized membrane protein (DUF485 family)
MLDLLVAIALLFALLYASLIVVAGFRLVWLHPTVFATTWIGLLLYSWLGLYVVAAVISAIGSSVLFSSVMEKLGIAIEPRISICDVFSALLKWL